MYSTRVGRFVCNSSDSVTVTVNIRQFPILLYPSRLLSPTFAKVGGTNRSSDAVMLHCIMVRSTSINKMWALGFVGFLNCDVQSS